MRVTKARSSRIASSDSGNRGSSEPRCSRDQNQPCPDDDSPGGSRDALTGGCETFDGDGDRDSSHRAQVHDPDDQQDRHQTDNALPAVDAKAQALSPSGTAGPGCRSAAREMTGLPGGEPEEAGHQPD